MNRTSQTSRKAPVEELPAAEPLRILPARAPSAAAPSRVADFATPDQRLQAARELLDRGALTGAEESLRALVKSAQGRDANALAAARCMLSETLEAQNRPAEAFDAVAIYESAAGRAGLNFDTAMRSRVQVASASKSTGDHPKAIALLQAALRDATEHANPDAHLGAINLKLANVYRSLNEVRIARDYVQKALEYLRRVGDWRELAGAHLAIAMIEAVEGRYEDSCRSLKRIIELVGKETAPHLLGVVHSYLAGTSWWLRRPHDSIRYAEKAISYYEGSERKFDLITCHNNLGINLTLIGEWTRAGQSLEQALTLVRGTEGRTQQVMLAMTLDSLADLCLLRGNVRQARLYLDEAHDVVTASYHGWYAAQVLRASSRCYLAMRDTNRAQSEAEQALATALRIGDRQANCEARLLLAEAHIQREANDEARRELREVALSVTNAVADLPLTGDAERLHGHLAASEHDYALAAHHFQRYLAICEMADDRYHTAQAHAELGRVYTQSARPHRAARHLALAAHAYRTLGAKADLPRIEGELHALDLTRDDEDTDERLTAHLLTRRIAEASASRELLLRELAAICYAETATDAVMVVEGGETPEDAPRLVVAHGSMDFETNRLVKGLWAAWIADETESFASERKARIVLLGAKPGEKGAFPPALLFAAHGAQNDLAGQAGRRLLEAMAQVAELGLEAYALRHRKRIAPETDEPQTAASASVMPGFVHTSPAMNRVVEEVRKIRSSGVTVLVTGESGTGKELVARLVHTLSERRDKAFVPFNCTAVPKELSEAYLFGYRRGAFTGATTDSPGVIRAAEGGTLFLDEIGDLPLDVQPKLLRFLQEGEIQPLGEQRPIKTDVRIVAATNSELERGVAEGRFREDLYYRLNIIRLLVPPLRERRSEIPALVEYYLAHYGEKFGRRGLRISEQAMELLTIADWAGNVRELCNEVQRLVARADNDIVLDTEDLSPELRRVAPAPPASSSATIIPHSFGASRLRHATLAAAVGELEQQLIAEAMQRHGNNISRVARELGLTRRGLYLKLERYGFA